MENRPELNLLKLTMAEKGITVQELSEKTKIPRTKLLRLLENKREWTVSEAYAVSDALELSDLQKQQIFLK